LSPILAIDIGSTKICTIIAESKEDGLHLMGAGIAKAQGLKKGSVVNIDLASKAIKSSLSDARRVAGININRAIVSLSGAYTKSLKSFGIVNVPTKEISVKEVNRAMQTALYNANIPSEYDVLHALPYDFKVDEQDNIQDPVGMSGSRLEVSVHIIAAQKSTVENLKKTAQMAGVEIENVVLSSYAASLACLGEDEKELGVCVVDIGGSTSNMAIHLGNAIRSCDFLGVGGTHVTGDLSMALHTPLSVAEKVKIEHGSLNPAPDQVIELPVIGNEKTTHEVSLEVVSNVMYARIEETLMILANQLEKSGFKNQLGSGIVLCGGMTKLEGFREVVGPIFDNMPVRIAKPRHMEGMFESLNDPSFVAVVGLICYGAGENTLYEIDSSGRLRARMEKGEVETLAPFTQPNEAAENYKVPAETEALIKSGEKVPSESVGKSDIADIALEREGDGVGDQMKKFWRWMTQIF